jgi:hypothetical protein
MAPMTRGVPYTDQKQFIFFFGLGEYSGIPGIPVNRIMGMLQQVRTAFADQGIGMW